MLSKLWRTFNTDTNLKIQVDTEQTELVLNLDQLNDLTRRTIGHYEFNAESYRTGTADHDVSQNYSALLDSI